MNQYDYIVAGAGASGLSLLMHMISSGSFFEKKILLVDKVPKTTNDRTWCFWESDKGIFEDIVYNRWRKMWFHGANGKAELHDISPYEYKMIRGIDFYNYCLTEISRHQNISVMYGDVQNIQSENGNASLTIDGAAYTAQYIFNSIPSPVPKNADSYFIWQHFKGWTIRTNSSRFLPDEATLMDFRIDQHSDCRFVYVMPFSDNLALVEYTIFSELLLKDEDYDNALRDYCSGNLGLNDGDYVIEAQEFGKIPMTNYSFPTSVKNIIYLGTAGGKTKASTGYTFKFIQRHSSQIVEALLQNRHPGVKVSQKKFNFYDSVLLKIITEKQLRGADIFTSLFLKNKMSEVMKFLDNDTSIVEDLKIMRSLPTMTFMRAAISHLTS